MMMMIERQRQRWQLLLLALFVALAGHWTVVVVEAQGGGGGNNNITNTTNATADAQPPQASFCGDGFVTGGEQCDTGWMMFTGQTSATPFTIDYRATPPNVNAMNELYFAFNWQGAIAQQFTPNLGTIYFNGNTVFSQCYGPPECPSVSPGFISTTATVGCVDTIGLTTMVWSVQWVPNSLIPSGPPPFGAGNLGKMSVTISNILSLQASCADLVQNPGHYAIFDYTMTYWNNQNGQYQAVTLFNDVPFVPFVFHRADPCCSATCQIVGGSTGADCTGVYSTVNSTRTAQCNNVGQCVANPTPSSTSTPSQTPTRTGTATPTSVPSQSSTPTGTRTGTGTGTGTRTPSAAPLSASPTGTGTPTGTATRSPSTTPSASHSATRTPTSSVSRSIGVSASNTPTGTPTGTPTSSASSSTGASASATPTSTRTPTRTGTSVATATPTPTHSASSTTTTTGGGGGGTSTTDSIALGVTFGVLGLLLLLASALLACYYWRYYRPRQQQRSQAARETEMTAPLVSSASIGGGRTVVF